MKIPVAGRNSGFSITDTRINKKFADLKGAYCNFTLETATQQQDKKSKGSYR